MTSSCYGTPCRRARPAIARNHSSPRRGRPPTTARAGCSRRLAAAPRGPSGPHAPRLEQPRGRPAQRPRSRCACSSKRWRSSIAPSQAAPPRPQGLGDEWLSAPILDGAWRGQRAAPAWPDRAERRRGQTATWPDGGASDVCTSGLSCPHPRGV
jgi:hypothetical protein